MPRSPPGFDVLLLVVTPPAAGAVVTVALGAVVELAVAVGVVVDVVDVVPPHDARQARTTTRMAKA